MIFRSTARRAHWGLVVAFATGCTADVVGPGASNPLGSPGPGDHPNGAGGGSPLGACGAAPSPGRSPLRRLNRAEYISTAGDLLGLANAEELAGSLPPDEQGGGFSNNADALVVTSLLAGGFIDVSERLAAAASADVSKLTGCAPTEEEAACASRFTASFGSRAFRRPLTNEELVRYQGMYTTLRVGSSFAEAIGVLVRAFLQSPHFLYRVEVGVPGAAGAAVVPVTPFELASRLSYALWGSMPDAALFSAAETGALGAVAGIESELRRMLADSRAHASIARFNREWLGIDGVSAVSKDPALFPEAVWNATLQSDLRNELETFVNDVFWSDGSLETLLSAPYSMLNANLAQFYGVPAPAGSGFVRVNLPPEQRAGILTSGGMLASLASNNQTSPVHRGKFVREKILCQELPAPPNDVVIKVPEPTPNTSTRQRYTEHSVNVQCAGCHALMDPIGFGFENYDPIGRYRTEDAGFPVDASGELVGSSAISGPFVGAVELAKRLATSAEARDCVATQVFRYTVGRAEQAEDACSLEGVKARFAERGYDMRELWVAVAVSDAFRFRSVTGGGQ